MVVVGAILLVLSLVLAAGLVLFNPDSIDAQVFGVSVTGVSVAGLVLTGIVLGVLAMLGLGMVLSGANRKRRKRAAVKREVRTVRDEQETLAERNARLEAELEQERTSAYPHDESTRQRS